MIETISKVIILSLTTMFVENTIFAKGLGASTMFLAARSKNKFVAFGLCITYFSLVSSGISYFADRFFSENATSYLFMPLVYVCIIGVVYTITLLLLWKLTYRAFVSLKKYIHVSAFNCAVLGAMFINAERGGDFLDYLGMGLGTGIGFLIATYLLSVVYERLYSDDIPASFRGLPITFIYIGILAMAFFGLSGYQIAL